MNEPRTRAGRYLYHGMAIRGLEHKAARDIVAIEQEAAALASPSLDDPSVLDPVHKAREEGYMRGYDDGKRASPSLDVERLTPIVDRHWMEVTDIGAGCSCGEWAIEVPGDLRPPDVGEHFAPFSRHVAAAVAAEYDRLTTEER